MFSRKASLDGLFYKYRRQDYSDRAFFLRHSDFFLVAGDVSAINPESGDFVKLLTKGTNTSPKSMAKAPALMGDCSRTGKEERKSILRIMSREANMKQVQTEALVARFQ